VKTINISSFKARCIALLKQVEKSRDPILITLRGKPVARVEPVEDSSQPKERILGAMKGTAVIHGDIVNTDFADEWEMNQ
jgi:prevent-host-death family protein